MKKAARLSLYILIVLFVLAFIGCGKKGSSVDATKPISEIKAEAEKMDINQLRATAEKYRNAYLKKTSELNKLMEKKSAETLSINKEANELMKEIGDLGDAINAMRERFQIYYDKLKEKGGDVSGLELK